MLLSSLSIVACAIMKVLYMWYWLFSSCGLGLDGSQDFFNLGWVVKSPFLGGMKFKVPKTLTWYFTDDLSNLPSWLFVVLMRLLMCWTSWRHFFNTSIIHKFVTCCPMFVCDVLWHHAAGVDLD